MAIDAHLKGGPWDGEALSLGEERDHIYMLDPLKSATSIGDEDASPAAEELVKHLYKLERITPNDVRIYRYECG